jgi:hypothetical protein
MMARAASTIVDYIFLLILFSEELRPSTTNLGEKLKIK